MQIRAVTPADRPQLWTILEPVIRAGETWALDRGMNEEAAWAYWTASDRQAFVAEEDGRLLGAYFLRANYPGGGAHIANTGYMVAQDAGGRGVGRSLCRHSMETAKAQGFRAMQFNFVVSTNAPAMHLWQSLGFEIIGRVPGGFRHPTLGDVDSVMMFREL
ncbi:GNAT family N-acetyltransferase [Sphingomonas sp. Root241]|uniref:GNAT family N-acetyltransferase n=1 Tax=Sphingomonas sp. Root241 TaxID=1736501 RepID=UPI0006F5E6A1|nr:GNAT family N-acetyltransferase [Sphingomonas sp. Root241]KRC81474.1 acetyltransferase [Sphingomonas sp. Root241]